jgi:hypothetical protein
MSDLVLDRVSFLLRDNRVRGETQPHDRPRKIFVDPDGRIRFGDRVPTDDRPGLAEVPQKTFA